MLGAMSPRTTMLLLLLAACGRVGLGPDRDFVDDLSEPSVRVYVGTRVVDGRLELDRVGRGQVLSAIYDSGQSKAVWSELSWEPEAPYGKPLPEDGAAETGYRSGNLSMAGNVLLVHFDESFDDRSGRGHQMLSQRLGGYVEGKIGSAMSDLSDGYVYTTVRDASSPLNFGTSDITWAVWVRSTAACTGNAVYMGLENPQTGLLPHLWLGCTPVQAQAGALGNTWCSTRAGGINDCATVEGTAIVNDGKWHHLAIVKSGHAPGTLTAYVDGEAQGTSATNFRNPLVFDNGVQFGIGAFSNGTYPASGEIDEAAVWRRALSPQEVVALHERGARRILLQVRACEDPACTSVPFTGPDGDPMAWYTEPGRALAPGAAVPLTKVVGRYVQYQAVLETDQPGRSPGLYSVAVRRAP